MPKLIYVITGLLSGGAERQMYYLIKNLPKNYEVKICAFVDGEYGQTLRKEKKEVIILDKNLGGMKTFLSLVKDFKPDIVQSWLPHANTFCKVCRNFANFRLICSMRGRENTRHHLILGRLERAMDFRSERVITNSHTFKNYLVKSLGYKPKKVGVIYNAFVPQKATRGKIRKELKLANKKIISVIANFRPGKDYPTAIKVAKEVMKFRTDFVFLFVGDGPERKKIEALVKREGMGERILFLGTRRDIQDIYTDSNIFFLPTLYEAQSNVLIEAMFYGCPIVTTDITENKEIIQDRVEGFLCKNGDYKEMAKKIISLLEDASLAKKISSKARLKAKKLFSLDKTVAGYLKEYESIRTDRNHLR